MATAPADDATPTPEDVLRRLIAGVTERRWDELPALYATDTVVEHPLGLPAPTRLEGRAAVAAHFDAARRLPLRMRAENVAVHRGADPGVVVGEFDYVGENTATGAAFRFANVFVLRVRDGLIVRSRDYSDHARLAAAFGRLDAVTAGLA
jgi:ketosteroid isomerase-like protein